VGPDPGQERQEAGVQLGQGGGGEEGVHETISLAGTAPARAVRFRGTEAARNNPGWKQRKAAAGTRTVGPAAARSVEAC